MKNNEKIEQHVLDKYQMIKKLGSGAYGHVWKVKSKSNGNIYALKKIFDAFQHSTDAQRTFRQISILKQLKHQKIIGLQQVISAENNEDIYLVFEFMESDLYRLIYEGKLQPIHLKYITYQLLIGLNCMHASNLIHRDLKPSNILLNSDCSLKICDFGLVRYLNNQNAQQNILTQGVATRWYRAPEVLLGSNSYGTKADIWSVGCIIAQMILKSPMFPGNCTTNQLQRLLRYTGQPTSADIISIEAQLADVMINQIHGRRAKKMDCFCGISKQYSDAIDLVEKMLSFNPHKRPSTQQSLKHPYLEQFFNQNDLKLRKQQIILEVDEHVKLQKEQYLKIIKEKYIEIKKQVRVTFSRGKQSNSPKRFSDLKRSKRSSVSKQQLKPLQQQKIIGTKKYTNLFKQLCGERQISQQKLRQNSTVLPEKRDNSNKPSNYSRQNKQNKGSCNKVGNSNITLQSTKSPKQTINKVLTTDNKKINLLAQNRTNRASFTGLKKVCKLQRN